MAKRDFQAIQGGAETTLEALSAPELGLLNDLRRDAESANGVLNRYTQGLAGKYRLGPTDQLDVQTGVITRAAKDANG